MMVNCDQEIVQGVAGKLRGGAGPSPVDGLTLGEWLLDYRTNPQALCEEMALWTEVFCNKTLPLVMVRALLATHMPPLARIPRGVARGDFGSMTAPHLQMCADSGQRGSQSGLCQQSAMCGPGGKH